MGIHVPSGEEVADFLESGDAEALSESCNLVTHFSEDVTLKVMRGPARKKFARREEEQAAYFRAQGIRVPEIYDVVKLRKLEKEKRSEELKGTSKKPWVVIMERIHGQIFSKLKKKKARKAAPALEDLLEQLEVLPVRLRQGEHWHLSEILLDPAGELHLLDFEMSKPGEEGDMKKIVKELRRQYRILFE